MSLKSLHGKTALITGSTSGIGLGIAEAFAAAGAHLVINGFGEPDAIEITRKSLAEKYDVQVLYSAADMSKPNEIRQMIADSQKKLGSLDILVNNAGIQHVASVEEFPEEKWDAILSINLSSNFHAIKAALPLMKINGWGRVINVASVHGLVASPYKSAYVAAKHAVVGLTKTLALELAETPITCNAICPGYVNTPLVEKQIEQQAAAHDLPRDRVIREVILAAQPSKRFVEVSQVAELALFLCSAGAASMTGSVIPMDGGWTAR